MPPLRWHADTPCRRVSNAAHAIIIIVAAVTLTLRFSISHCHDAAASRHDERPLILMPLRYA